jgi:hypothetical protein
MRQLAPDLPEVGDVSDAPGNLDDAVALAKSALDDVLDASGRVEGDGRG